MAAHRQLVKRPDRRFYVQKLSSTERWRGNDGLPLELSAPGSDRYSYKGQRADTVRSTSSVVRLRVERACGNIRVAMISGQGSLCAGSVSLLGLLLLVGGDSSKL